MNLVDLTPGVKLSIEGSTRIVKRVVMHPAGPTVILEGGAWQRHYYSYRSLVLADAEVVA